MDTLTLDYVQRIAEQKGLKVLHNPEAGFGAPYCVAEGNECAAGRVWLARTLQEVLDGLERELPRREWREAYRAAWWCWFEEGGGMAAWNKAKAEAGITNESSPDERRRASHRWWDEVGQHLQRDWAARNPDLIARWKASQFEDEPE